MMTPHILAVDDDHDILMSYRAVLEERPPSLLEQLMGHSAHSEHHWNAFFRVSCATRGEEARRLGARALAEGDPVACALVDMRMAGGWDGLRTVMELQRLDQHLHAIIVTAYSDHSAAMIWQRLDHNLRHQVLLLKKPYDHEELRLLVAAQAERYARINAQAAAPINPPGGLRHAQHRPH